MTIEFATAASLPEGFSS